MTTTYNFFVRMMIAAANSRQAERNSESTGSEPEPQLAAEAAAAATEAKLMPEAFERFLSDDDEPVGGVE